MSSSNGQPQRPIPSEGSSDPASATSYGQFVRALKLEQPCARLVTRAKSGHRLTYPPDRAPAEVLKRARVEICGHCTCRRIVDAFRAFPIHENVRRDELAHEIPVDGTDHLAYLDWSHEAWD